MTQDGTEYIHQADTAGLTVQDALEPPATVDRAAELVAVTAEEHPVGMGVPSGGGGMPGGFPGAVDGTDPGTSRPCGA